MLTRLGLAAKRDSRPTALRRGMRAEGLAPPARSSAPVSLKVMDEPVHGLDPASQRTLQDLIAEAVRTREALVIRRPPT